VVSTLICGIGNKLKGDDGIGPHVIEVLEGKSLPPNVSLLDLGISGFKTALEIGNYNKIVFIDAVQSGQPPGRVSRTVLTREEVKGRQSLSSFAVSLHESGLEQILATADSIDSFPRDVIVIGCEPQDLSVGLGLSPEVERATSEIIDLVLKELTQ
jgi:hydrogenase maturation protease